MPFPSLFSVSVPSSRSCSHSLWNKPECQLGVDRHLRPRINMRLLSPQKDPFMHAATNTTKPDRRVVPWNKGKLIGQEPR